jgi:hypothetical protein
MSFLDRLFGAGGQSPTNQPASFSRATTTPSSGPGSVAPARSADEIAVERYRYLLRTAPPETIEQVHRDAFSKLTPQQRDIMFEQLTANSPRGEQPVSNDPASLATAATRSELRSPGTMERSLSGGAQANGQANAQGGQGMGFGGTFGSSMLGTVAGYVVASSLMSMFLPGPDMATDAGASDAGADNGADQGADTGADTSTDASADAGADFGGGDAGGDFGGGFGDFGDFGF